MLYAKETRKTAKHGGAGCDFGAPALRYKGEFYEETMYK